MFGILLTIINLLYYILFILILARVILSWVNVSSYTVYQIRDVVFRLTEPILAPVRRMMPSTGGIDFSPMIVLLAAWFLRSLLIQIIF
jgi:YggT family protein